MIIVQCFFFCHRMFFGCETCKNLLYMVYCFLTLEAALLYRLWAGSKQDHFSSERLPTLIYIKNKQFLSLKLFFYFNRPAFKIFAHTPKFLRFSRVSKNSKIWKIEIKNSFKDTNCLFLIRINVGSRVWWKMILFTSSSE